VMVLGRAEFPAKLTLAAAQATQRIDGPGGVIGPIAAPMFKQHLLAFELTSMLLLTAIVGAVVIGKKRTPDAR
jgi:NADH:ubiquinone oxidoreductase subunit 6 (subunit J)